MVVVPHLLLHLTTQQDPVDHWALDIDLIAMHKVSLLPAAGDQALWGQWQAIIPFIPMLLKMVRCPAVSLNPPTMRETVWQKMAMPEKTRAGSRPLVTGRWCQISQVFGVHEDTEPELDTGEKIRSIWQKQHPKSPKEDSPLKESSKSLSSEEEPPTDETLHNGARQKVYLHKGGGMTFLISTTS